jgi:hypothetical protein
LRPSPKGGSSIGGSSRTIASCPWLTANDQIRTTYAASMAGMVVQFQGRRPAGCFHDRPRLAASRVEPVEPRIGIRLHQPRIAGQMVFGVLAATITRIEEPKRRGRSPPIAGLLSVSRKCCGLKDLPGGPERTACQPRSHMELLSEKARTAKLVGLEPVSGSTT